MQGDGRGGGGEPNRSSRKPQAHGKGETVRRTRASGAGPNHNSRISEQRAQQYSRIAV